MYDPYGYYKDKNEFAVEKNPEVPFYEDFPMSDNQWFIGDNFVPTFRSVDNILENPMYTDKIKNIEQKKSENLNLTE